MVIFHCLRPQLPRSQAPASLRVGRGLRRAARRRGARRLGAERHRAAAEQREDARAQAVHVQGERGVPSGNLTSLWKITILMGKSTINGPFSIAMLNYQRVSSLVRSLRESIRTWYCGRGNRWEKPPPLVIMDPVWVEHTSGSHMSCFCGLWIPMSCDRSTINGWCVSDIF